MKHLQKVVIFMLLLGLMVPALVAPSHTALAQDAEELQLVTARATADLVRAGRVLMSARGNHWVYDSVPPIGAAHRCRPSVVPTRILHLSSIWR